MRVLVTGGHGFIGRWTIRELLRRGHVPVSMDRKFVPSSEVEGILGDVRDPTAVAEALGSVEAWIHLAGVLGTQETISHPMAAVETNVMGGLNVLEGAARHHLPGVYIGVGNHWMDNTYSISKTTVERFCSMYRQARNVSVTVVRAYNAYGPGQTVPEPFGHGKVRKIVPSFVSRALVGAPVQIYGSGDQVMDMIYVSDVASVLVTALEATVANGPVEEPVEAGSGLATTVRHIAETVSAEVARQTGSECALEYLPMRPGEPAQATVLASTPMSESPDAPRAISLSDGIGRTVTWYRKEWLPTWKA